VPPFDSLLETVQQLIAHVKRSQRQGISRRPPVRRPSAECISSSRDKASQPIKGCLTLAIRREGSNPDSTTSACESFEVRGSTAPYPATHMADSTWLSVLQGATAANQYEFLVSTRWESQNIFELCYPLCHKRNWRFWAEPEECPAHGTCWTLGPCAAACS